jgi:hypothetical protein
MKSAAINYFPPADSYVIEPASRYDELFKVVAHHCDGNCTVSYKTPRHFEQVASRMRSDEWKAFWDRMGFGGEPVYPDNSYGDYCRQNDHLLRRLRARGEGMGLQCDQIAYVP